jgi:predicted nuclease with TOPRIM domain
VKDLNDALQEAKSELRAGATASANELPALKVKCALLEDELHESRLLEAETEHLRQEYDELQTEAAVAREAASRLSHIVHDLSHRSFSNSLEGAYELSERSLSSVGSELLDDSVLKEEFGRAKANEAWVGFIVHVYSLFKEDMRILGGNRHLTFVWCTR